jgi:hypothetical protein
MVFTAYIWDCIFCAFKGWRCICFFGSLTTFSLNNYSVDVSIQIFNRMSCLRGIFFCIVILFGCFQIFHCLLICKESGQ